MKNTIEFWDTRAKKYDVLSLKKYSQTYRDTIELTRKYLKKADIALDYACGTGITTIELSNEVQKIIAFDVSEGIIQVAKMKSEKNDIFNTEFKVADIHEKQF